MRWRHRSEAALPYYSIPMDSTAASNISLTVRWSTPEPCDCPRCIARRAVKKALRRLGR